MRAPLGIYEKALPKDITWEERFQIAKKLGFQFIEMSVDETDERLARLEWSKAKRQEVMQASLEYGIPIRSICLSGHRRYPFSSHEETTRKKAREIMKKGLQLAADLGVRVIQLAGYDVYYEEKDETTRNHFIEGLKRACELAAEYQIIIAIEIMDDPFMSSITKYLEIKEAVPSQWLKVYPDLGNLSAWTENNVPAELEKGITEIVAIHLKDTLAVTTTFPGKFRDVIFGEGCVDFDCCLEALAKLNYKGPFLIEMWSEVSENYLDDIEKAKQYLIPKLEKAGF